MGACNSKRASSPVWVWLCMIKPSPPPSALSASIAASASDVSKALSAFSEPSASNGSWDTLTVSTYSRLALELWYVLFGLHVTHVLERTCWQPIWFRQGADLVMPVITKRVAWNGD